MTPSVFWLVLCKRRFRCLPPGTFFPGKVRLDVRHKEFFGNITCRLINTTGCFTAFITALRSGFAAQTETLTLPLFAALKLPANVEPPFSPQSLE